jgi:hypothetical protein
VRDIDENTRQALRGSRTGDRLVCWVWYDGRLALDEPLDVSSWSFSWDGSERAKVQGSMSLTVKDPDGQLGPWLFEDPLGVGGSRLQVSYLVGGAGEVRIGWFRVISNQVDESWKFRVIREDGYVEPDSALPQHYRSIAVSVGSSVQVEADELTAELDSDEFLAPEQPAGTNPTVFSELTRLIGDTLPLEITGVTDSPLSLTNTWDGNRLEVIQDILAVVDASYRMGPDGELDVYMKDPTPVFTCAGGPDGVLVSMSRKQSINDVYNIGVVTSSRKTTAPDGSEVEVPIVGTYQITTGPLRTDGPFGRRVIRNGNPLMNTQEKADKAAETLVLNRLAAQTVDLDVSCLPDPSIQVGDYGTIVAPVVDGRQVPLVGECVSINLSGAETVSPMSMTVRCLLSDAAAALKGFSIANRLTGTSPAMTYDNVNPLRTNDQMNTDTDGMSA